MKNSTFSMLLGTAMLASFSLTASAAPKTPLERAKDMAPLSRMRKAEPASRWSNPDAVGNRQKRVAPQFTTPASDTFEYVYAPDGSLWYAVTNYDSEYIQHDYYTEQLFKGFTITVYDNNWNEIGQVRDSITVGEGETRCAQIMIGSQLTKQFFNNDGNVELMVSLAMNTPEYMTVTRTYAYSIKKLAPEEKSVPITVIPGYPVDDVDCAKDKWSEEYYITFLTEEQPEEPEKYPHYIDFLADCFEVQTTYGKGPVKVMEHKTSLLTLPGDQMTSPMMVCKKVDGNLTLTYAQYEKSFFVDPTGMGGNEAITDDNALIIETYRMNDAYPREMELINTTRIKTVQNTQNPDVYCTYYGIGNLMWHDDVDFGNYTTDGRPAFVVSTDDYIYSDDDHYNSGYYVYDADGNRIKTIAENTHDFVMMSDLPGFEPQAMFVHMGDEMNFEFVDLYSAKTVTVLDHSYRGYSLSVYTDRVPYGDSYAYASSLSYGMALEDDVLGAPVLWIGTDGEIIRLDVIPTGKGVELAQVYMNSEGLNPFLFNSDADLEYLLLVKRAVPGSDRLREELLVASVEKGTIHSFTEQEGKGILRSVILEAGADPELIVIYIDDDNKFRADSYSLPFEKTLKGSGTLADPYLITSAGDLQMIKDAPSACYLLANDIDCANLDFYPIAEFKGTLDGAGHTVSNLRIITRNNSKTGIFVDATDATIKNINFYRPKMILSGGYETGLIAATATRTTLDNIHAYSLSATGDNFSGEFGGLVGKSVLKTAFKGCELVAADIALPACQCMGGIVGDVRTGTTVTGCAVSGNLTAGSTLGGIVGSTTTGDEEFTQCHVSAYLKAEHTIGGIAGFLDRSKVKNNYVEGTIEATKPSKWNNAIAIGGIAGELEGDWQGNADVPVAQNLIAVSALITPDLSDIVEKHPRQLATVHRVIGRSCYNSYLEEDPSKIYYEGGVYNNYVISDLACVDPEFNERSIEGTSMDKDEVDAEWLENTLGFAFGSTAAAPWNIQSWPACDPSLFYESFIFVPSTVIAVEKGKAFNVEIAILSPEPLSEEDIIGDFMCEYDESLLEMTGDMNYDGKTMKVEFKGAKEGETRVSFSILGNKAECLVKVSDGGSAVEGVTASGSTLSYSNGILSAEGQDIAVYDINGKALLNGKGTVDASSLASGIYVAVATDKAGKATPLKFAR